MDTLVFHSRKEKETFLKDVIQKLSISEPEKEIYCICIEVLEDSPFDHFFEKIASQFPKNGTIQNTKEFIRHISL